MDGFILPLILLVLLVPLFLSSRRQKKMMAEMQDLQRSLNPGDRVMTTSGLHATVVDVDSEDTIDLEIAPGVVTTWIRAAVREKVNPEVDEPEVDESDRSGESDRTGVADHTPVSRAEIAKPS